jgi:sucrose-6-phosphate hydrolase SacC (GH32 family)
MLASILLGAQAPIVIEESKMELYQEIYRPQFHFTAEKNWLNDPNGLVFYRGEYHLFFQHNPQGIEWGNMTWGHAISRDLVHWRQLPSALMPDTLGTMFSGSAVVDWQNSSGFKVRGENPLVLIYTAAGGTSEASKGQPFTQCLAFSNDRGRSWTKYYNNPVLRNIQGDNRDPKVFWHKPTRRWIMSLYVPQSVPGQRDAGGKPATLHTVQFFASADLKDWTYLSQMDGLFECPDLFELPVDDQWSQARWVLFGADGEYWLGHFDGFRFMPESGKHRGDWGKSFYAAQTYSDIPSADGRRMLIAWMRGGQYPNMPFNQQMTFPCELSLRRTPEGIQLCKWPVREIASLYARTRVLENRWIKPGENPLPEVREELLDLDATIVPDTATSVGFVLRGATVKWDVRTQKLDVLGCQADLAPVHGQLHLRLLLDRSSLEVFGGRGLVTLSTCFLPAPGDRDVAFFCEGGEARLLSLKVRELESAWPHESTRKLKR